MVEVLQHAAEAASSAPSSSSYYSIALISALSPIFIVGLGLFNHHTGKKREGAKTKSESTRQTELSELKDLVKDSHREIKLEVRDLRETMAIRLDRVESAAKVAQRDATAALHGLHGLNGDNGLKKVAEDLRCDVDSMLDRERDRLERAAENARLRPSDVGTLTPRTAG